MVPYVLTSSYWPIKTSDASGFGILTLPSGMKRSVERFEKFYLAKHSGRRLTWNATLVRT